MGIFSRKKQENLNVTVKNTKGEDFQEVLVGKYHYSPPGKVFNLKNFADDPESLSAFFGGIELISNSISSCPIFVKQYSDEQPVKNHPVMLALKYGRMTKFNFIKQLIHDVYVYGNGLAYIKRDINGDVKELIYCPPRSYAIYTNEVTMEVFYKIPKLFGETLLDSNSVIHIYKNSIDGMSGISIPSYAKIVLPLASAADKSALQFYDSGCNLNYVVQGKKILDTEEKMDIYNEMTNAFRGGNKNGNFAVIGNDLEIKTLGLSQKEAQALETRQYNITEIARYLNINPVLLGISAGSTYNNIEQAQMDLVIHTLLPLINLIEEEFNRKLIRPSQRDKYYIDFDEDKIMFATKNDTANYLTTLTKNGIISVNESRKMLGFAERPDDSADALYIPYTNINQNTISGNNNGNNEDENKEDNKEDGKEKENN